MNANVIGLLSLEAVIVALVVFIAARFDPRHITHDPGKAYLQTAGNWLRSHPWFFWLLAVFLGTGLVPGIWRVLSEKHLVFAVAAALLPVMNLVALVVLVRIRRWPSGTQNLRINVRSDK